MPLGGAADPLRAAERRVLSAASAPATISAEDFTKKAAVFAQDAKRPGENAFKDSSTVLQELGTMGNPPNIQNLIASIGPLGAEEILSLDPTDKHEGFRELESWVDGSLDMYRVRLSRDQSQDPCACN